MKKNLITTLIGASFIIGSGVSAGEILKADSPAAINEQYIVVYKNDLKASKQQKSVLMRSVVRQNRGIVKKEFFNALTGVVVKMNKFDAALLADDPNVLYVEQDQVVSINTTQNNATWGLDRIDQPTSGLNTKYTYPNEGGAGVHVYIIDTGVDLDHPDFAGRMGNGVETYDSNDSDPGPVFDPYGTNDCNGHGTHVAGTVASTTYGVAKNAIIHPIKVLGCSGSGTTSGVVEGMDWVAANHQAPAVANMSLGGGASPSINTAVDRLHSQGILVVAAAGNQSANACSYSPASAPNAITVAASTTSDSRASFSNYGGCIDIYAPGNNIRSSKMGGGSTLLSGTSMAAPHVAGAAALYLSQNSNVTPAQVTQALITNAIQGQVSGHVSGVNHLLNIEFMPVGGGSNLTAPANFKRMRDKCYSFNSYTWSSVPGATYYEVWSNKDGVKSKKGETSYTSYAVNMANASIYAKACNANGCGAESNSAGAFFYPFCM
jgi:serine protease